MSFFRKVFLVALILFFNSNLLGRVVPKRQELIVKKNSSSTELVVHSSNGFILLRQAVEVGALTKQSLDSLVKQFGTEIINTQDNQGNTILHYWALSRHRLQSIKDLLEQYGADLNLKNNEGRSPKDIYEEKTDKKYEITTQGQKKKKGVPKIFSIFLKEGRSEPLPEKNFNEAEQATKELIELLNELSSLDSENINSDHIRFKIHNLLLRGADIFAETEIDGKILIEKMPEPIIDYFLDLGIFHQLNFIDHSILHSKNNRTVRVNMEPPLSEQTRLQSVKKSLALVYLIKEISKSDRREHMLQVIDIDIVSIVRHIKYFPELTLRLLSELEVNFNEQEQGGSNLVHQAMRYSSSPEVILFLHREGVNINEKNDQGETPLFLLFKNPKALELAEGVAHLEFNFNIKDFQERTVLYYILEHKDSAGILEVILRHIPEKNLKKLLLEEDNIGNTIFHEASLKNKLDSMRILMNKTHEEDPLEKRNILGFSPLDEAAIRDPKIVDYLATEFSITGSEKSLEAKDKDSLIIAALFGRDIKSVISLLPLNEKLGKYLVSTNPIIRESQEYNLITENTKLKNQTEKTNLFNKFLNFFRSDIKTDFEKAVRSKDEEQIVQLAKKMNSWVNKNVRNKLDYGQNILHYIFKNPVPENLIPRLLNYSSFKKMLYKLDHLGRSPLHEAAYNFSRISNMKKLMNSLSSNQAKHFTAKDELGYSALTFLGFNKSPELVRFTLESIYENNKEIFKTDNLEHFSNFLIWAYISPHIENIKTTFELIKKANHSKGKWDGFGGKVLHFLTDLSGKSEKTQEVITDPLEQFLNLLERNPYLNKESAGYKTLHRSIKREIGLY